MDIALFTNARTGELVPISQPDHDHAFIPDALPPAWEIDAGTWAKIADAKMELGRLDGAAKTLPNPQLLLSPLRREESLTSSALEGTYAKAEELMLFELEEEEEPPRGREPGDAAVLEVNNYNKALAQGYQLLREWPFCARIITELHETLMTGVRGGSKNPGQFRNHQVHIGSDRRYIPPPADRLMETFDAFERYVNRDDDGMEPLVKCFIAHYQFEAIHPFSDGNGRIGRVLLSLMIYKWCKLGMPWLYMSPFFDRYKDEYIGNLFKVSSEGAWKKWIDFCMTGVIEQCKKTVRKCDKLRGLRDDMRSRVKDGKARSQGVIDSLFEIPFIRAVDIARDRNVSLPTARAEIAYLMGKGILRESSQRHARSRTYYAPEIIAAAYEAY